MADPGERIVLDTGPLVAFLIAQDAHHDWARAQFSRLIPPLHTCEAVLTEAQFLVQRFRGNPRTVLEFVQRRVLKISLDIEDEVERLHGLQRTYRDIPMSLADACLVRMTELHARSRVFTTDSHFQVYRRNERQLIPLLTDQP